MTESKINTIIEDYIRGELSPKEEERNFISAKYQELSKMLEGENFQTGSYARFTSITPVNDLDIIWVLPSRFLEKVVRPEELNPTDILRDLAHDLENEYQSTENDVRIVPQSHSVGIYFEESDDGFSIDVVPAIPAGEQNEFGDDVYLVPEIAWLSKTVRRQRYSTGESIEWIKSDPRGYIKAASELNEKNESFRKTVKLVKAWKNGCKKNYDDFPLKSFHLELIVVDIFRDYPRANSYGATKRFFDNLMNYLETPQFPDRADSSKYVDDYIDDIDIEVDRISSSVKNAQDLMSKISQCEDERCAHDLLNRLLTEKVGEEPVRTSAPGITPPKPWSHESDASF